jgi:hypothetical protein
VGVGRCRSAVALFPAHYFGLFWVFIPFHPSIPFSAPFSPHPLFLRKTFFFSINSPLCPKPSFKQNFPFFLFLAISPAYRFVSRLYRFVSRPFNSLSFLIFLRSFLYPLLFSLYSSLSPLFCPISSLSFSGSRPSHFASSVYSALSSPSLYTSSVTRPFSFAVSDPSTFLSILSRVFHFLSRAYLFLSRAFRFLSRAFFRLSFVSFLVSFGLFSVS